MVGAVIFGTAVLALGVFILVRASDTKETTRSSVATTLTPTMQLPSTDAKLSQLSTTATPTTTPSALESLGEQTPVSPEEIAGEVDFDVPSLRQLMLDQINKDRVAAGLQPLEIDAVAENAAQSHADEMTDLGYVSHWNVDGFGPDWRYTRIGGRDSVRENIYGDMQRDQFGLLETPTDWAVIVDEMYQALTQNQWNKENIFRSEHTHVGIGISYRQATGIRVVQEFVSRYVNLAPLPIRVRPTDRLVFRGILLPGVSNPRGEVIFEPYPTPMSLDQLNLSGNYSSPSDRIASIPLMADQSGGFQGEVMLSDAPGLYHLRILVDRAPLEAIRAVDIVVEAR